MSKLEKRVFGLEVKVAALEDWTVALRGLGRRRALKVESLQDRMVAVEGLMRELVLCVCDKAQDKEGEEMIEGAEGASRQSYAGALLSRLKAMSGNASDLAILAVKVEKSTIGSSPCPENPKAADKPASISFIDKANDALDVIATNLIDAKRRLGRVQAEFTCGPEKGCIGPPSRPLSVQS